MSIIRSHSFVICAYGDSPYLEDCIASLKSQTVKSSIILTTSTPSLYIENICKKYDITYHIRNGNPSIGNDWNEALRIADTKYVTIAHQDDIYEPEFLKYVLTGIVQSYRRGKTPQIVFTDYYEYINERKKANRRNLIIKRMLLSLLRIGSLQGLTFAKRSALRLGNAICCPTVTYNRKYIDTLLKSENREGLFDLKYRSNLDWNAWIWLSDKKGAFVYISRPLISHRIHEGSETSRIIRLNDRTKEDYEMFARLWPKSIAKQIAKIYKKSETTNTIS